MRVNLWNYKKKKKCLLPSDRGWVLCMVGISTQNYSNFPDLKWVPGLNIEHKAPQQRGFQTPAVWISISSVWVLSGFFPRLHHVTRPCQGCQHDIIFKWTAGGILTICSSGFVLSLLQQHLSIWMSLIILRFLISSLADLVLLRSLVMSLFETAEWTWLFFFSL